MSKNVFLNIEEMLKRYKKIIMTLFLLLKSSVYPTRGALYNLIFELHKVAVFHWKLGPDFVLVKSFKM
jgi:hypothetical protein